jgi:hypothetical protein
METMVKAKQRVKAKEDTFAGLDETTKLSISIMGGVSALIGVWAAAGLISAMIGIGGPLQLVQSWFSAVTGL